VFDFDIVMGTRDALRSRHGVVINETTARNYFGDANPIDKTMSIVLGESFVDFSVKAVVADLPSNSSIRFYILISDLNYPKLYSSHILTSAWFNITPETYVLLREGVDPNALVRKFPPVFKTILGEEEFNQSRYTPGLQPLTSIHLDTDFPVALAEVNDPRYSYILAGIALLILLVACINFVTLAVGRSIKRAKEVGIRKVVGALRKQLVAQFIGEAMIVTFISLGIGFVLAFLTLPIFNDLANKRLVFLPDVFAVLLAAVLLLIIGVFAGSYPAFVVSGFKPIEAVKGRIDASHGKIGLRKILVGIQLILSIFLISSTLLMRQQLDFLQNKNLGFNREQLVVVPLNITRTGRLPDRIKAGFDLTERFKLALAAIPEVVSVSGSGHDFGHGNWTSVGYTDEHGTYRTFNVNFVDENYAETLQMSFLAGRNFSSQSTSDARRAVIINEAFAKGYDWSDPIGKRIPGNDFPDHQVIGVVKDFNFESLYTKVAPLMLTMNPDIPLSGAENINIGYPPIPKLIVRIAPGDIVGTIDKIKGYWAAICPGDEFGFSFVDQALNQQYRSDINLGKIVSIATLLAVVIGCLGLYALASLAMQNRTREISIRKVMGASEQSLLVLLSRDYIFLIGVCLLLSIPMTWYLMSHWLESFEYRVAISWKIFALAGCLSLTITFVTISYQAIKTAWTRPAETLKYE
jgi:putative ABC transport system permease protein